MENPWHYLPEKEPFILSGDSYQNILEFNNHVKSKYQIHLELFPEPYTGNPGARIILLNLNPGFDKNDEEFLLGDEYFKGVNHANLIHKPQKYPFYLLDPRLATSPGYKWWRKKLRQLIDFYGLEKVTNEICSIEYFPYHSQSFKRSVLVPSQEYSFYLVREAIKREAVIIIMRGKEYWKESVPELRNYNYHSLRNPQNIVVTQNNCPIGYNAIKEILQ